MKKLSFGTASLFAVAFSTLATAQRLPDGQMPTERKLNASWQLVPLVMPIHYHVVDSEFNPLPFAQITAWSNLTDSDSQSKWTDAAGDATVLNRIDVDCGCDIVLPGYYPWHGKLYEGLLPTTNRYTFHLQRLPQNGVDLDKGTMTGTLRRQIENTTPTRLFFDLFERDFLPPYGRRGKTADVALSLDWTSVNQTNEWRVSFEFENPLDGIAKMGEIWTNSIYADDFHPDSAPSDGYVTNLVFSGAVTMLEKSRTDGKTHFLVEPVERKQDVRPLAFRIRSRSESSGASGYYGFFLQPPSFSVGWDFDSNTTNQISSCKVRINAEYWINPMFNSRVLVDKDVLSSIRDSISNCYHEPDGYQPSHDMSLLVCDHEINCWTNSFGMVFVAGITTNTMFSATEVTCSQFGRFATLLNPEANYGMTNSALPVVNISPEEAESFCSWLTDLEHMNGTLPVSSRYRLPTFSEWVAAALNGEEAFFIYSWGGTFPPPDRYENFLDEESRLDAGMAGGIPDYSDGFLELAPVASFASNKNGLFDMAGNVSELCSNDIDGGEGFLCAGASWNDSDPESLIVRNYRAFDRPRPDVGFRCVIENMCDLASDGE